jgi:hypothetical protein
MSDAGDRVEIVQEGMDACARGDMAAVLARFDDDLAAVTAREANAADCDG